MSKIMTKQKQFELAKELRASGLTLDRVGEIVGATVGRKPYSGATISGWVKSESYEDYCKKTQELMKKYNQKVKEKSNGVSVPKELENETRTAHLLAVKTRELFNLCEEITQLRRVA